MVRRWYCLCARELVLVRVCIHDDSVATTESGSGKLQSSVTLNPDSGRLTGYSELIDEIDPNFRVSDQRTGTRKR